MTQSLPLIYFLIASVLFGIMLWICEKWDPETNLRCDTFEAATHGIGLLLISFLSFSCWKSILEQILSLIILTILQFCAHTDYKTKFVYRFFNLILVGVSLIFFVVQLIMNPIEPMRLFSTVATTLIYVLILIVLHKVKTYGTGDVLSLIGNALFIVYVLPSDRFFTIEILLWHYCLAVILLIVMNFTKFNWKQMKLKEEIAFLPQIYLSTVMLMLYFLYF